MICLARGERERHVGPASLIGLLLFDAFVELPLHGRRRVLDRPGRGCDSRAEEQAKYPGGHRRVVLGHGRSEGPVRHASAGHFALIHVEPRPRHGIERVDVSAALHRGQLLRLVEVAMRARDVEGERRGHAQHLSTVGARE